MRQNEPLDVWLESDEARKNVGTDPESADWSEASWLGEIGFVVVSYHRML